MLRYALMACAVLGLTFTTSTASSKGEVDTRVDFLLKKSGLKYKVDKDGDFKLTFAFDDSRSQVGFINSNTNTFQDMEIREVWSIGYKSTREPSRRMMRAMLETNAKTKVGSWSMIKAGRFYLCVFRTRVRANADMKSLDAMIRIVVQTADEFEKKYLGSDDL